MSGGAATALDQVVDQLPEGDQLIQAALDLGADEIGAQDAPSPLTAAVATRKAGRPKGSRNRRTEAVAAWLLSQHRHPVAVMLEAASMQIEDFMRAAGFREDEEAEVLDPATGARRKAWTFSNDLRMECLKLQYRLAEAAAPYVAQKLPQAVQVQADGAVQVTFAGVSLPARGGSAGGGDVIEAEALPVRLPFRSDEESRTDA